MFNHDEIINLTTSYNYNVFVQWMETVWIILTSILYLWHQPLALQKIVREIKMIINIIVIEMLFLKLILLSK